MPPRKSTSTPTLVTVVIQSVGIDEHGRVWVEPKGSHIGYAYVYRAAMEVYWDSVNFRFLAPLDESRVGLWQQWRWLKQIVFAAKEELGVTLSFTPETNWLNFSEGERLSFEQDSLS